MPLFGPSIRFPGSGPVVTVHADPVAQALDVVPIGEVLFGARWGGTKSFVPLPLPSSTPVARDFGPQRRFPCPALRSRCSVPLSVTLASGADGFGVRLLQQVLLKTMQNPRSRGIHKDTGFSTELLGLPPDHRCSSTVRPPDTCRKPPLGHSMSTSCTGAILDVVDPER